MKLYAKNTMELLATGNSHCCLHVLHGDICLKRSYRTSEQLLQTASPATSLVAWVSLPKGQRPSLMKHRITHLTKSSNMLNKNTRVQ